MPQCLDRLAAALALGLPLLAAAQGRADPAGPTMPAPALVHSSALADYRRYQDITPGDWRRLNDTVGRAALKPAAIAPAPTIPPAAAAAPAARAPMPQLQGGRP